MSDGNTIASLSIGWATIIMPIDCAQLPTEEPMTRDQAVRAMQAKVGDAPFRWLGKLGTGDTDGRCELWLEQVIGNPDSPNKRQLVASAPTWEKAVARARAWEQALHRNAGAARSPGLYGPDGNPLP